jgi:hypothetical protein
MTGFQRLVLAVTLACMPWLAHAQGYKCRQADGTVSYQDHACPSGTASSSAVSTDQSLDIGLPPLTGLDAPCQQSVHHAVSTCLSPVQDTIKRCYKSRLSSSCNAQMLAGNGSRNAACASQAAPCVQDGVTEARRCIVNSLPPTCVSQLRTAGMR